MTTRIMCGTVMASKPLRGTLLGLLLGAACAKPASRQDAYPLTVGQRRAVDRLLATQPGWRVATRSDNRAPDLAAQLREQPGYEPYIVRWPRGDAPDFAIVLVRGDQYAVYWFRGKAGMYRPVQVTSADWLDTGGLFLQGDTLEVAPFHSDEIFAFTWDAAASGPAMVPADSGDP